MNIKITLKNEELIELTFPYNTELISAVKKIPGRRWHPDRKLWTYPNKDKNTQYLLEYLYKTGSSYYDKQKNLQKNINIITPLEKTVRYLRLKEYSPKTIYTYKKQINWFFRRTGLDPKDVRTEDIILYLEKIKNVAGCSRTYAVQCISALKCFYSRGFDSWLNPAENIPLPKKDHKFPDILSRKEISDILEITANIKHKFLILLIYSAGLRVSEAVNLKINDLDFERKMIHIRSGKGKKDRYVMLSEKAVKLYLDYSKQVMLQNWLFPGQDYNSHLSIRSAQSVFIRAIEKTEIQKKVSIHSLRHAFATHLLEDGVDLRYIQELLGHKSSKTTEIYTHVTKVSINRLKSPIDRW